MIDTIMRAINNKKEISLTYKGVHRLGHPAAVGVSMERNEVLHIYHPLTETWKLCYICDLSNVRITDNCFHEAPPGYAKKDHRMSAIYTEI